MIDRDQALEAAALRYRMIAETVEGASGPVTAAIRSAAAQQYRDFRGEPAFRSERSLWRDLAAFRERGFEGLVHADRKDRGMVRAISPEILDRAIALRRERKDEDDPLRTTTTIIDILVREKRVARGALKRSTLDRHFEREGVSRRLLGGLGKQVFKKILSERVFELVLVDFHHGPYVRVPPGYEARRALLCAFIDHFSRYVPEARYYLHEDFAALRFGFRRLLAAFGCPEKIYRDNGGAFQATRFRVACSRLDINLVASKPYAPEGRGCNERFNRTVKEQFESEVKRRDEILTLDELNTYFAAWLAERYHRDVHSETGETPLDRFHRTAALRAAPDLADVDEFLRIRERRSVHRKASTIEVAGLRFSVTPALRGRKVHALYDPSDLAYVLVEFDGKVVERAFPQRAGDIPRQPPAAAPSGPKTDYLELLRTDHASRDHAELSALRLRSPTTSPELSLVDLIALVERCRAKVLSPEERDAVAALFRKLRPLDPELSRSAIDAAQRSLGPELHVRVYLDALEAFLVRQRARGGVKP